MLKDVRAIIQACNDLVVVFDRHPTGALFFIAMNAIALTALIIWLS